MYLSTLTVQAKGAYTEADTGSAERLRCLTVARQNLRLHVECFREYEASGLVPREDYGNG